MVSKKGFAIIDKNSRKDLAAFGLFKREIALLTMFNRRIYERQK